MQNDRLGNAVPFKQFADSSTRPGVLYGFEDAVNAVRDDFDGNVGHVHAMQVACGCL